MSWSRCKPCLYSLQSIENPSRSHPDKPFYSMHAPEPETQHFRNRLLAAAALTAVAFLISPYGIEFVTGRGDLTFRVTFIAVCSSGFVLLLAGAAVATGRARPIIFYLILLGLPVAF